jgi:predicted GNAT family acetyltransferase
MSGTNPDHRGRGLATRLIRAVAAGIRARPHIDLKRVADALCCS